MKHFADWQRYMEKHNGKWQRHPKTRQSSNEASSKAKNANKTDIKNQNMFTFLAQSIVDTQSTTLKLQIVCLLNNMIKFIMW